LQEKGRFLRLYIVEGIKEPILRRKGRQNMSNLVPQAIIEKRIFMVRGHKVMVSGHLADLYVVKAKALIQAVKRNIDRFPQDFMFRLTWTEVRFLRSQIVTLDGLGTSGKGRHTKYEPYAFTEQGVAMLSSVLNSKKAVQVNIAIMRAFVNLRQTLAANKELAHKLKGTQ